MPDLLGRLRAALADRYAVEREIGRGGMATVFLAEDLKHGRRVAIKVLHPALAASLGPDRFLREIRISANLDHPHVLAVHDSGQADGLLYFVMPYVEGESLRGRLEREGALPVPEALRIAREVARALDYAHGQGVVHRDIKPGNVLLSEGHARIADFGVAKAVDAASEGEGTAAGLAVGTPKYMSPEQGMDGVVDGRTDVYALGSVLYEMLTGAAPFEGPSARAILSRKTLGKAPSPRAQRRDVPAEVDAVVRRALAPEPDDRFQTAGELGVALHRLLVEEEAEGQRSVLRREFALLAGVSALALAAVMLVVFRGGLPYWLLAAVALTLVLEVPFLSAAAVRLRGPQAGAPLTGFRSRLWALRGTALAGAAGVATLGVGSTSMVALGAAGIGPLRTLISRGLLGEHPTIVVADFETTGIDPSYGSTIAEALRTELDRAGDAFDVVNSTEMEIALESMRRSPRDPVDRGTATEIALRMGAEAVLAGEVSVAGSDYTIFARLTAAATDEQLLALSEGATGAADVMDAAKRLAKRLMVQLGEPLREVRRLPNNWLGGSSSFEALKLAWEAQYKTWLEADSDPNRAIRLLNEAVALDSTFANAHWMLGQIHAGRGEMELAREAWTRAWERREGASDQIRAQIEFFFYYGAARDLEQASQVAERALDRWGPGFVNISETYKFVLLLQEKWADAEALALDGQRTLQTYFDSLRAEGLDVGDRGRGLDWAWTDAVLAQRKFRAADSAIAGAAAGISDATRHWWRYRVAFAAGEYDRAAAFLDSLVATGRPAGVEHARTAMAEGRVGDAAAHLNLAAGLADVPFDAALLLRTELDALVRNDTAAAARTLESALADVFIDTLSLERLLHVARGWTMAGRPGRANAALEAVGGRFPGAAEQEPLTYGAAQADVALLNGRPLEAVAAYRRAYAAREEAWDHGWDTFFRIGRAFEAAGMPDSAIVAFERTLAYPGMGSRLYEHYTRPLSTERLAALYEARGDAASALAHYRAFAELWKDADPALQPRVEAARGRIAQLGGDPRGP